MVQLYFPQDDAIEGRIEFNSIADYLEIMALLSEDSRALVSDIANQFKIGAGDGDNDIDEELRNGVEEIIDGTITRLEERAELLDVVYPFEIDIGGDIITYVPINGCVGQTAYLLSLILSNLKAMSPILDESGTHPADSEVRTLRNYFQYFATAALAAEICGHAWSFGFPRSDRTGFLEKLDEIWQVLGDGSVEPQMGTSLYAKDDKIDVFAARPHLDRLPGFPLAVAQVATGKNALEKSLRGHLGVFKDRWFSPRPVTDFIPYMIIPFAMDEDSMIDYVRVSGNVLHRLRVPGRVAEAEQLIDMNLTIEGYDQLAQATQWIKDYRDSHGAGRIAGHFNSR